ncbi:MAG TPA: Ig-like domain repeat protein, partial [Solirubrobacteraceae bacterium]|nr:Ig-like domain repeat protein [Solirubrobacteraceae bacterium]
CTAVGVLNSATYVLAATDVGHTIKVLETAADAAGTAPAVASLPTGAVTGNKTPPSIAGIAQEGQVLRLTKGVWTDSPTLVTDQWQSCVGVVCNPVGTLNSLTYLVAPTDVGHTIQVVETATNALLPALTATAATGSVSPLSPPVNVAAPGISGTPQQGQTLTLALGIWMNSPASITDQWQQCDAFGANCVALPGQTGTTYALTPGDVGHTIGVVETASNDGGAGLPAASGHTTAVTATSFTSVVAFSSNAPTTNQTVTLVATISSSSGNASPSGSVTFFNGSGAIGGCTGKPVNGGTTVTVICPAGFGAGTAQISAAYQPGPGSLVVGSTSAPTSIAIGRDSTSVSLAVTSQVNVNSTATYSAALVLPSSNSGPIGPTGSIAFLDGGQPIPGCGSQQMTNLTATCTQSYNSTGTHQISAVYSGDANFAGSTSSGSSVQVVKSGAITALGFVKSLLRWSFFYHPTYTSVMQFVVSQIAQGTTVELQCQGNGCAFKKVLLTPRHKRRSMNLLARFDHKKLKPGTRVTVRVVHPNWVGKFFSFTIRAGAAPVVSQTCIPVGKTNPGSGC